MHYLHKMVFSLYSKIKDIHQIFTIWVIHLPWGQFTNTSTVSQKIVALREEYILIVRRYVVLFVHIVFCVINEAFNKKENTRITDVNTPCEGPAKKF